MQHKSVQATFKAGKTKGEFTAEFSVYDNVDLDGDRILKGALIPALEGNPNPAVVYSHGWDAPPVGETLEAKSTETGGQATARLFVDDYEPARGVWAGVKSGALKEYSFAFGEFEFKLVQPEGSEKSPRHDGMIQDIPAIKELFEWGPTLVGANRSTRTIEVAKAALKRLSDTDLAEEFIERLKRARIESTNADFQAIHDLLKEMDCVACAAEVEEEETKDAPDPDAVAKLFGDRPMLHLHSRPV